MSSNPSRWSKLPRLMPQWGVNANRRLAGQLVDAARNGCYLK
ncbi:MAG: hypothetical protein U0936_22090 [Planctomycetaceae bacterium]